MSPAGKVFSKDLAKLPAISKALSILSSLNLFSRERWTFQPARRRLEASRWRFGLCWSSTTKEIVYQQCHKKCHDHYTTYAYTYNPVDIRPLRLFVSLQQKSHSETCPETCHANQVVGVVAVAVAVAAAAAVVVWTRRCWDVVFPSPCSHHHHHHHDAHADAHPHCCIAHVHAHANHGDGVTTDDPSPNQEGAVGEEVVIRVSYLHLLPLAHHHFQVLGPPLHPPPSAPPPCLRSLLLQGIPLAVQHPPHSVQPFPPLNEPVWAALLEARQAGEDHNRLASFLVDTNGSNIQTRIFYSNTKPVKRRSVQQNLTK